MKFSPPRLSIMEGLQLFHRLRPGFNSRPYKLSVNSEEEGPPPPPPPCTHTHTHTHTHTTHHVHTNNICINIHTHCHVLMDRPASHHNIHFHSTQRLAHTHAQHGAVTETHKSPQRTCRRTQIQNTYCSRLMTNVSLQPPRRHDQPCRLLAAITRWINSSF